MKIIGITGNIASGKTTISKIIADHYKIPLVNVDEFSKNYIALYPLKIESIINQHGYTCNDINKTLQDVFFKNKNLKLELEIVISLGFWDYIRSDYVRNHYSVIIIEHPVLFEMQEESCFDYIIGVNASEEIRIDRMKIRGYSDETILERIANQTPLYANKDKCDLIIDASENPSKKQIINELQNSREFKATIS